MQPSQYVTDVLTGMIYAKDGDFDPAQATWNPHAKFPGVRMLHLILGEKTQGRFSAHIVHIEKGHEIGEHIHPNQIELHEVISGHGTCYLPDRQVEYRPGVSLVAAEGESHRVVPKDGDMYLLAKFFPALA